MTGKINYEQVAWMQPVKSRDGGEYLMLGKVTNPGIANTLAVTPAHGNGETMFFCLEHEEAYGLQGICTGCRLQVRTEAQG
jgi:hypothetical protein